MLFFVRFKTECDSVIAVAQSSWLGSIFEHVAVVTAAVGAVVLGALHEQLAVRFRFERVFDCGMETRPARATFKFHVRVEQRMPATGADESSLAMFVIEGTGETAFRAFFA